MTNDRSQSGATARRHGQQAGAGIGCSRIRNYFLTGLIVAGPVAVTAVADLVVRHLGGQSGAAVHSGGLPAGDLSAGQHSRASA